jgi:KRAB domain-containing zinc finger protein
MNVAKCLKDAAANGYSSQGAIHSVTLQNTSLSCQKEKKNKCDICPYRTVKRRDLLLHQLNHTFRENYLKCRYCEYYLLNTKGMKQHEILHGVIEPQSVNISFYQSQDRQSQGVETLPIEPESLLDANNECLKTETIVLKDKSMNEFTATYFVVKSIAPKTTAPKTSGGATCKSEKAYREKGSGTMYRCSTCPYTTKYSTHLREHLPNHKLYPGAIKCRYCVYYASNSLNAKQHELLHPEYEPDFTTSGKKDKFKHQCKMCPFEAPHPYLIDRHSQNHIYKENYAKCKHCDYFLVNRNNMNQHEILHKQRGIMDVRSLIENRRHLCKICPFQGTVKSQLEKHMKFHNRKNFNIKKGFYQCKYCKYYSDSNAKIKEHEILHVHV